MKHNRLTLFILSLLMVGTALAGGPAYPKFELYALQGSLYTSMQQRGRAVILVFFARPCLPCRMEVPSLNSLKSKYPDTLTILGIAFMERDRQQLQDLIRDWNIKYTVIPDPDGSVAGAFNNSVFPHSFLMDHTGKIVADYPGLGEVYTKDLQKRLADLQPKIKEYRTKGPSFYVGSLNEYGMGTSGLGKTWQSKISSWVASAGTRISPQKGGADYIISGSVTKSADSLKIEITIHNAGGVEEIRFSETVKGANDTALRKTIIEKLKTFPYAIRKK